MDPSAALDNGLLHVDGTCQPQVGLANGYDKSDVPIAIIGMSCRFPGEATSPERLWKMCAEGRSAWSEIPSDRFKKEAFFHPESAKRSTMNVQGGYFLKEDVGLFDATFFNMTPEIAATMDPQCRLQLESVFEALESAGIPIESIAGSKTAVLVGAFFKDYMDSLMRDPDTFPRYVMTGNGATMMSNRISHFYDLRGPSMTVDTGCSTGLVALHQACMSLKTGDVDMAIVGGANVMINPDIFVLMSSLGFLSPDGKSYAFDSRAGGYGRGEGVGTIILKPLKAALQDGDPIRSVIRQTMLNQDGKTQTITSPNQTAQEDLIRLCYERAGLQPTDTVYVEAHGTGTQAGDPIEAGAIYAVMCGEQRPSDRPLYMGSVKTNVGHMETASGFASIIKVALALEKGYIPPSINFKEGNNKIPFEEWNLKVPQELLEWPAGAPRRASINNFGYGGANAHVIMEAWQPSPEPARTNQGDTDEEDNLTPATSVSGEPLPNDLEDNLTPATSVSGEPLPNGLEDGQDPDSRVFILSAKDETALCTMAENLVEYVSALDMEEKQLLNRVAHTLDKGRSRFPWSIAATARTKGELVAAIGENRMTPIRSVETPRLGFVFTGQGAQWYAMGRELIGVYPAFVETLREAESCLKSMGCTWSLFDELTKDKESSRINDVVISPPLCIAVQIALVRLLASWGVRPSAITSHSSGEVAAAYAAGLIDLREAMAIVYARGGYLDSLQTKAHNRGGMMAVGLGPDEAEKHVSGIPGGRVVVACHNSPSSVTLSGDLAAITELEKTLKNTGIFARALKVPVAYHSHHMSPVAEDYLAALQATLRPERTFGDKVRYTSPVTGQEVTNAAEMGPEHWVHNMLQPVRFVDALRNMCLSPTGEKEVDMLVEIGPHSALAGPIRQCLQLPELKELGLGYGSCLVRDKNAVDTMQALAASLAARQYPIDLQAVNFPHVAEKFRALPNLPSYPWNHSTRHWWESRINLDHRQRPLPRHDLLGSRLLGSNSFAPTWRHIITASDLPWVRDHTVQSAIVYPGAGLIVMAVEAMRQLSDADAGDSSGAGTTVTKPAIGGYRLKDIEITAALVIPDDAEGVEVQLCLREPSTKTLGLRDWREFLICSAQGVSTWIEHCRGLISVAREPESSMPVVGAPTAQGCNHSGQQMDPSDIFAFFQSNGIYHGPTFRNLKSITASPGKTAVTASQFAVADTAASMPGRFQQNHVLHATTLDSVFQAAYSALDVNLRTSAMVPRSIKELFVSAAITSTAGDVLCAHSSVQKQDNLGFSASVEVVQPDGQGSQAAVLQIKGLFCQSLGPSTTRVEDEGSKCLEIRWDKDLTLTSTQHLQEQLRATRPAAEVAVVEDMNRACFYFFHSAVNTLGESDIDGLLWYHKIFHQWMKLQIAQQPRAAEWLAAGTEQGREVLFEAVSRSCVDGQMICRIGRNLAAILRQEIAPLELMLQDQLLYRYYREALRIDRSYEQVNTLIKLYAHKTPGARVLEIGAGTGGCTQGVLEALGRRFTQYDFTDISSGFFEKARTRFAAWQDLVRYRALNIESDPAEQGFELGSYDLIVACQVLHATKNMDVTMSHVRSLLKPGGKLIMVETTHDVHDIQLIFGVLPGWWLSEEPERKHSPSLTPGLWNTVLRRTGFSGLDVELKDCEDDENYVMNVLMSTAVSDNKPATEPIGTDISIVYNSDEGQSPPQIWLADSILATIQTATCRTTRLESIDEVRPEGKLCIVVDNAGAESSMLASPSPARFAAIRRLATTAAGVLWVSHGGAIDCENPLAALHTGFLRTLRCENTSRRYVSLNLEHPVAWDASAATAIVRVLQRMITAAEVTDIAASEDSEFATRHDGSILIPRVYEAVLAPDESLRAQSEQDEEGGGGGRDGPNEGGLADVELQPFRHSDRVLRMGVAVPGMLDSLVFADDEDEASQPLPDEFVEIEPQAFGLNFRDVMVAMGQLQSDIMGFECSGIITRVGAGVPKEHGEVGGLTPGSRVCALLRGHWATRVRVHWTSVISIPAELSFEAAASIPVAYVTAYHSLYTLAQLRKGESVLVHSAAGAVGQAAIALAQLAGADVFVTAGSDEKRAFLTREYGLQPDRIFSSRDASFAAGVRAATPGGRGVDVVLNSLAGQLLHETWTCVAPFGRFVEIGKRDLELNNSLQMAPFARAASFFAVDLIMLGNLQGEVVAEALAAVMALFREGKLRTVEPVSTYAISDVEKAFRTMQAGKHRGKLVIVPGAKDVVKTRRRALRLSPQASYVVVGGAGGLGRSITRRLVERGARNLVLLSRTATAPKNNEFFEELRALGANVVARDVDISDAQDLARAVEAVQQTIPPIRGVIQGAMVLQDSIVENMTHEDYMTAVRPKVQGTWNLYRQFFFSSASSSSKLGFFIMLSSLTGVAGNSSQANYAAGGTFQDALARSLAAKGLPAVSLDLGMVSSVGYVAETEGVAARLGRQGYKLIRQEDVLRLVEDTISSCMNMSSGSSTTPPFRAQVLIGLSTEADKLDRADAPWTADSRFAALRASSSSAVRASHDSASPSAPALELSRELGAATTLEGAGNALCAALVGRLSHMFALPAGEVDRSKSMAHYGIDSLVAVELRNWLASAAQSDVSIFDIMQSPSLAALAVEAALKSRLVSADVAAK